MIHAAPRAVRHTLLFRDWLEAHKLWTLITQRVPGTVWLCLMPDHLHLALEPSGLGALRAALAAYALWRNAHRGQRGPVWEHRWVPTHIKDGQHARRTARYIHLNPCRKGLVGDPLAWPFSTHRDALGLAAFPARPPVPDPYGFHAWVSADPTVSVGGSTLPATGWSHVGPSPDLEMIADAVGALTRLRAQELRRRGPARRLWVRSLRMLTALPARELAAAVGLHHTTVLRTPAVADAQVQAVARVLGDPRFAGLAHGDLRTQPGWRPYRHHR